MGKLTIQEETLTPALIEELTVLALPYWREMVSSIIIKDRPRFDAGMYLRMAAAGGLALVVARNDGRPVGFILGLVGPNPHYACTIGTVALYFLEKQEREGTSGLRMLRMLEGRFAEMGADYIETHAKVGSRANGLFMKIGYSPKDHTYVKSLKRKDNG